MKMLDVVLVDDESIVLSDMRSLIDWEAHGFSIAGWSYRAEYALQLVRQHKPDIIFLDISLPGMNGLELAEKVREIQPGIVMIILSGYRNFEYAKRAIDLGILTYLVKHQLTAESLLETLEKARGRIEQQRRERSWLRRQALRQLLEGAVRPDGLSRDQQRLLADYPDRFLFFVAAPIQPWFHPYDPTPELHTALQAVEQALAPNGTVDLVVTERMLAVACLLPEGSRDGNAYRSAAAAICAAAHSELLHRHRCRFAVAYPHRPTGLDTLQEDGRRVRQALGQAIFRTEAVYGVSEEDGEEEAALPPDQRLLGELTVPGFRNRYDQLMAELEAYLDRVLAARDRAALDDCSARILELVRALASGEEPELPRLFRAEEVAQCLLGLLRELRESVLDRAGYSTATNFIIAYIEGNYNNQPTIQQAAVQLGGNGTYLGQKFRKETGRSFNEYLTRCRILRAKGLLAGTNLRLAEVSRQVGIHNSQYFGKVFHDITGMSPQQYRDRNYDASRVLPQSPAEEG